MMPNPGLTNEGVSMPEDSPCSWSDDGAISRRTLLRSGAAAVVGAYSLNRVAGSAARARVARVDEAAIRQSFAQTAKSLITPGAFMILRGPGVDLAAAYGSGTLPGHRALGPREHFRCGSVTKTFTGTAILQAAQRGDLRLDHPVSRYRPDVPNGKHITIEQLLTMRSGLYNYSLSLRLNETLDRNPGHVFRPRDLLRIAYEARPNPDPGKEWEYSNTNTVLLGLIAEKLFDLPLAKIFHERLFEKLGMRGSSLPAITSAAIPRPHPRGYMFGTNVSTLKTQKLPPREIAAAEANKLKPNDVTGINPSWAGAAGAAISTAEDLATWVKALCDGSLLNRRWQRRRLDSIQPTDPIDPGSAGYGLAIAKFGPLYGHTGKLPGFQTFTGYDPARRLTLIVWTNLSASPRGLPCASTIAQELAGKLYA
jgi:CubicO group peptidase (beta-lactamase class C family)